MNKEYNSNKVSKYKGLRGITERLFGYNMRNNCIKMRNFGPFLRGFV